MSREKNGMKTRYYYTEYVNHMVRFYITCPETLRMEGKKRSDIENWLAVQGVFHYLPDVDREKVQEIYKLHYHLPKAVEMYCAETGEDANKVWVLLARVSAQIAKRRGLI